MCTADSRIEKRLVVDGDVHSQPNSKIIFYPPFARRSYRLQLPTPALRVVHSPSTVELASEFLHGGL